MPELLAPQIVVRLDDGTEWTVATGNPDLVAWDMTAAKHKWPADVRTAPFLWLTFLAWHGSRRKQLLPDPGMTWETFKARAEYVQGPGDDDDDAADDLSPGQVVTHPTAPGVGPG